jgi:serine/threonine protein kinase
LPQPGAGLRPNAPFARLADLIKSDLRSRYARGERPAVADYLEWFPQLRDDGDQVVSLAYEEYCLREEQGEWLDPDQFCDRYLPWRDSLASQMRYHRLLSLVIPSAAPAVRLPEPGEHFGGFRIDSILGLGGTAQVYLARDDELGGRPVVLKIAPDRGREPSILGILDHMYIMPALSITREAATGLRALCMPYRPGLPLNQVIHRVGPAGRGHGARALWRAVAPAGMDPSGPGWEGFPDGGSYPDAAAWVALSLARALEYVHSEGILHGDIKPANVLLTLRHGPQLLDFGFSRAPDSGEGTDIGFCGGTLPYMAPEQLEAFLAPDLWKDVGAPADLYGLGLLLAELLTGRSPAMPDLTTPLPRVVRTLLDWRAASPSRIAFELRVPKALGAIVTRCLAFLPSDRYPNARSLVEDLRRYLDRRPARGAPSWPRGENHPSRIMQRGRWGRSRSAADSSGGFSRPLRDGAKEMDEGRASAH